ncbi:MAG: CHRD domain-containing protein [Actinomycetia bacterium]|nr:CHRD domain-containing protein [Actinomycetes bacterium]
MQRKLILLLAAPAALLMSATAAAAPAPPVGTFSADLTPIPHDSTADGGSNVTGHAALSLAGRNLTVDLTATGLTPNEPHAMHIHGVLAGANECPPASADVNTGDPIDPVTPQIAGTPDGLISLAEGLPSYGPIDVSFTQTGDTSAASGLVVERFPVANAAGTLSYHRSIKIPIGVAKNLSDLHIVVHGTDLPSDADHSSLSSLFEATLPVACGTIN